MLKANELSYKAGGRYLLNGITAGFEAGKMHAIMGANGAGKTTLLKLLAGDLKPFSGTILWDDKELKDLSAGELAKKRAVLSQHYLMNFPIEVGDVVMMGRYPFFGTKPSAKDIEICQEAAASMNIGNLWHRDYTSLSGGEAQKVQMSRVLAQIWPFDTSTDKILFLDEPVSHLDVKYQHQLLTAAKELSTNGMMVIAVLHDINLAVRYADRILFMKDGGILHDLHDPRGISAEIVRQTFDMDCSIMSVTGRPPIVMF